MEPEISHRCQICGAAFRKGEKSCPQCGANISTSETDASLQDTAALVNASNESENKRIGRGSTAPTQPFRPTLRELPFAKHRTSEHQEKALADESEPTTSTDVTEAPNEGHSKAQRVKDAAKEIMHENLRPQVEKLRHASSVVFEEAAIDPSLRFVLIAVFVFIVFLVLLLLSFIK